MQMTIIIAHYEKRFFFVRRFFMFLMSVNGALKCMTASNSPLDLLCGMNDNPLNIESRLGFVGWLRAFAVVERRLKAAKRDYLAGFLQHNV